MSATTATSIFVTAQDGLRLHVRSHVRSLCAKTASSGVRELVNRVAILPPVAPSPLGQIH